MKSKLSILLKNQFLNTYRIKSNSKKKTIGMILVYLYAFACLGVYFFIFTEGLYSTLDKVELTNYYLTIILSLASMFSFFLTIFSAKNGLFDNKDNDLVFSLPVKRSTILTSRFLYICIHNLGLGLLILIPGLIIFFINNSVTFGIVANLVILVLFFSIIPTILAAIFGYFVALLTSKARAKNLVELGYYILFILVYFAVIYGAGGTIDKLLTNMDLLNVLFKTVFLPLYLINISINTGNIIYALAFVGINLVVLYLFILLAKSRYLGIISKLSAHQTKSNFKMKEVTTMSIRKSLLIKEAKRYFSSAIYVFNTLFGVIFIIIAAIASFAYTPEAIIKMVNLGDMGGANQIILLIVMFVLSLSNTANSSISIEGNNFWILKMLPVKEIDILSAKVDLNRLLVIPITILSELIFFINGYLSVVELLFIAFITVLYCSFIAKSGLLVNLALPKLNAVNDTVIVKQSAASLVGIMIGFGVFVVVSIISSIGLSFNNILYIVFGFSLLLYIISDILIKKWGVKKFRKIS